MYNSQVNNPFISDPTNAQSRYPDINNSASPDPNASQFTSWLQPGASSNGFQMNQQPGMYQQQQPQQMQQFSGGFPGGSGYSSPQSGFQPSSNFGQMMTGQMNGGSYGYLNGQNNAMSQPQQSYNPAQQQLQSPSYIPSLDPYASLGQGWDGSNQQQQMSGVGQGIQSPTSPGGSGFQSPGSMPATSSIPGKSHPREYIRAHKAEIEAWDQYAWKQLLNTFDDLKDAWQARKKEIDGKVGQLQMQMQYSGGGYYAMPYQQEIARLQALSKDADSHHDSVAASSFQVHEVFQNYRQSGDSASKRRVREASNAALQSLPDWPAAVY